MRAMNTGRLEPACGQILSSLRSASSEISNTPICLTHGIRISPIEKLIR